MALVQEVGEPPLRASSPHHGGPDPTPGPPCTLCPATPVHTPAAPSSMPLLTRPGFSFTEDPHPPPPPPPMGAEGRAARPCPSVALAMGRGREMEWTLMLSKATSWVQPWARLCPPGWRGPLLCLCPCSCRCQASRVPTLAVLGAPGGPSGLACTHPHAQLDILSPVHLHAGVQQADVPEVLSVHHE